MERLVVIYDACVLYPAPLRDLLINLAVADLFQAKWTEEIHGEWIDNLLANRPDLTKEKLIRTKNEMNFAVPDSMIYDYEAYNSYLKFTRS